MGKQVISRVDRCAKRAHRVAALTLTVVLIPLLGTTTAWADSAGSIEHVETTAGELRLLYSLPGLDSRAEADLTSLRVSINDDQVKATAAPADEAVRRTTMMTIDVSNSMRGQRFAQAKQAAKAFLDTAPDDVLVGIVTFAKDVETVQKPTLDRSRLTRVLDRLELSRQTRLYDGVIEATKAVGKEEGQRSLLVLSDGKDTSDTPVLDVTAAVREAKLKVDIVALEQSTDAREPLEQIAGAGEGALLTADDPKALVEVFSEEADELAKQVLVTVAVPDNLSGAEGSVAVALDASGEAYTDTAFVTLQKVKLAAPVAKGPREIEPASLQVSSDLMWLGLGGAFLGGLLILLMAFGVFTREKKETLEDLVSAYSRTGDLRAGRGGGGKTGGANGPPRSITESAVGLAQKALAGNRGFEANLAAKLEAAGMSLKPAEWLLLHSGIAVVASLTGFLLSSGRVLLTLMLLAAGVVVPWVYLGFKKSRRLKAFNSHLAETLHLISGGLSAGLSLAQSVDTVVREGTEPIAGEFRRALVETRLGVQLEDALALVGQRMQSDDFAWVVMAIRIQRDVGGNLGELLLSVAATMREREYLRRQVKSLSAEGRLSGLILGGLPPGVLVFLTLTNPGYLEPLFESVIGWLLIAVMAMLMAVGSFWMSRLVKVEV